MTQEPLHSEPAELVPTVAKRTRWWREGLRAVAYLRPQFGGDSPQPLFVLGLTLLGTALTVVTGRLYFEGPVQFYAAAFTAGWLPTALQAWICWCLVSGAPSDQDGRAPSAAALFTVSLTQGMVFLVIFQAISIPFYWMGLFREGWTSQLGWWLPMGWYLSAQGLLFWRGGHGSQLTRGACALVLAAVTMAASWSNPLRYWYPQATQETDTAADPPFELTPEIIDAQALTLPKALARLKPQRAGLIDVYTLTYAPYAEEDVFMRESRMVNEVMGQRFDAEGRSLELLNHKSSATTSPWATSVNLKRSLKHLAQVMDREEDVLFIHLTSHGAKDGSLYPSFWPLTLTPLTAAELKAALDEVGIRHRVISISACYSGSWLAPLADEHTLTMTAADADHTSYGCGRGSLLTYFGRAMYDEALRNTRNFEAAHATARRVIAVREKEVDKQDGYSNPQLQMGAAMRTHLQALERQLTKQ